MGRLIDADKIIFCEIDEVGGEYEPYLGCSKSQINSLPTVEAIPKDQYEQRLKENNELINDLEDLRTMINKFAESYENRLKADMVAMLTELQLEIEEMDSGCGWEGYRPTAQVIGLIQQKINALKGEE